MTSMDLMVTIMMGMAVSRTKSITGFRVISIVLIVVVILGGLFVIKNIFQSDTKTNSTVSNPSLVKTLGATNENDAQDSTNIENTDVNVGQNTSETTQTSRNESTQPSQDEYSPPSTLTYVPPQTPPAVVECNTALLDAWNSSYASTQSYYDSLVVAESTRSASRLQSALEELSRRGMLNSGLAVEARNNERILKEQNISNIENSRNAAHLSLQNSYPANCD